MKEFGYILVYNPISNEGHLDSWHVLFIQMLRAEGWKVIALSMDSGALRKKLLAKGLELSESLIVYPTAQSPITIRLQIRRVCDALRLKGDFLRYQVGSKSIYTSLMRPLVLSACAVMKAATRLYRGLKKRKLRRSEDEQVSESVAHPSEFAQTANQVLVRYPDQICTVLNMYMDMYRIDADAWKDFKFIEAVPWFGVCITPSVNSLASYHRLDDFKGTFFLDEAVCAHYQSLLPNKKFEYMPDITDTDLPASQTPLANEVLKRAAGRRIIFMGGSIGKQKNLVSWYELIRQADCSKWYFVQIGRINENNLTPLDQAVLANALAEPIENLTIYPDYLADEREFNQLISVSDIIFAVYRDFRRSSNMLSKAAYFEKPILVSDAHLMGERVRRYKIGIGVKEDEVASIVAGLNRIEAIPISRQNFEAYRQDFNIQNASQRLSSFIRAGLTDNPSRSA
jgi:hypothetical protein